jgi:hypothetical protein
MRLVSTSVTLVQQYLDTLLQDSLDTQPLYSASMVAAPNIGNEMSLLLHLAVRFSVCLQHGHATPLLL